MSVDMIKDVIEFHNKFGIKSNVLPTVGLEEEVTSDGKDFRLVAIDEEIAELKAAYENQDAAETLDAIVDAIWFLIGTAHRWGLPIADAWKEVARANLSKEKATSEEQSKRGSAVDIIKPEGWVAPNIEAVVENYTKEIFDHADMKVNYGASAMRINTLPDTRVASWLDQTRNRND